jgi:hypothetical protein
MTDAEWLDSKDPDAMLAHLDGKVSDRKLRLFACACCRSFWGYLKHEHLRRGVLVAERYADGLATELERAYAEKASYIAGPESPKEFRAIQYALWPMDNGYHGASYGARALVRNWPERGSEFAVLLRDICGNPFRPVTLRCAVTSNPIGTDTRPLGKPCPCWACSLPPTVLTLARYAYEERLLPSGHLDPVTLAVLADALEEAGCVGQRAEKPTICPSCCGQGTVGYYYWPHPLLAHLRSPGSHVRGCWAVDPVSGKE